MQSQKFLAGLKVVFLMLAPVFLVACADSSAIGSRSVAVTNIQLGPTWTTGQRFDFVAEIDVAVLQTDAAPVPNGAMPKVLYQLHQMPMQLDATGEVQEVSPNGAIQKMVLTVKSYKQSTQENSLGVLEQVFTPNTKIGFIRTSDGDLQYSVNDYPTPYGENLFRSFTPIFFATESDLQLYGPKASVNAGDTWQASTEFDKYILTALANQGFIRIEGLKGSMKLESLGSLDGHVPDTVVGNFTFDEAVSPGFDLYFWGLKPSYQLELTDAYPEGAKGVWKRTTFLKATAKGVPISGGASSPILSEAGPAGISTVIGVKVSVEITLN